MVKYVALLRSTRLIHAAAVTTMDPSVIGRVPGVVRIRMSYSMGARALHQRPVCTPVLREYAERVVAAVMDRAVLPRALIRGVRVDEHLF